MVQQFRTLSDNPNSIPRPCLVVPEVIRYFRSKGSNTLFSSLWAQGTGAQMHRQSYKTLRHFNKSFISLLRSIPRGLGGFIWFVCGLLFAYLAVVNFFF